MKTLEEVKQSTKEFLTPSDVAPILGCQPYSINVTLREDAVRGTNRLGFNAALIKNRVKIPRRAFIAFMTGESVDS